MGETPDPIPNSVVKPIAPMVLRGRLAWESRTLPGTFKKPRRNFTVRLFYFINCDKSHIIIIYFVSVEKPIVNFR
uniref:Uncharacterized protein n=1 Tax=uncultured bacterium 125003-E23 TaxID=1343839 RepID=S4W4R1_9BACT|nr:hypothetical protein [uncultured bacterium 125003-E23]